MKKKIALVGNGAGTMIRFRLDLIKSMVEGGHQVFAFAPDFSPVDRELIFSAGAVPVDYSIQRSGTSPLQDLKLILQFYRLFKKHQVETVFSYFVKPVIYASIAARWAGVREIYSMLCGLGYLFTKSINDRHKFKRFLLRTISFPLFKYALYVNKMVFFQNPDDQDEFVAKKLVTKEKTLRLYGSGVNLGEFPFTVPKHDPVTFITLGRLLIEKGFREYAAAAEIIKNKYPDTRFILLGGHDENPAALPIEEVKQWFKDQLVEWPGRVENVEDWLNEASVFVLPSYREGTPRSTLEAMATGRAVITTDVPGCRETVKEGVNGFLVPAEDVPSLVKAMETFIKNPYLVRKMGKESRKLAEQYYDVNKVNHSIIEVIAS